MEGYKRWSQVSIYRFDKQSIEVYMQEMLSYLDRFIKTNESKEQ